MLYLFVGICQLVLRTSAPQLSAPQQISAGGGVCSLFPTVVLGFSYPAVSYLVSLEVCFSSSGVL